jgi:hypothetical protein
MYILAAVVSWAASWHLEESCLYVQTQIKYCFKKMCVLIYSFKADRKGGWDLMLVVYSSRSVIWDSYDSDC